MVQNLPTVFIADPITYKTELCRNFLQGKCSWGDQCKHAHSVDERRQPGQSIEDYLPFLMQRNPHIGEYKFNQPSSIIQRPSYPQMPPGQSYHPRPSS